MGRPASKILTDLDRKAEIKDLREEQKTLKEQKKELAGQKRELDKEYKTESTKLTKALAPVNKRLLAIQTKLEELKPAK